LPTNYRDVMQVVEEKTIEHIETHPLYDV